jgi:hypothetical protein
MRQHRLILFNSNVIHGDIGMAEAGSRLGDSRWTATRGVSVIM